DGDATNVPDRHSGDRNKPTAVEEADTTECRDDDSPAFILKQGLHAAVATMGIDLAIFPPCQIVTTAKPDGAIAGGQHGTDQIVGQALFDRECDDGEYAKAVEAV